MAGFDIMGRIIFWGGRGMSITVEQIMRLPGMRGARVLAGREGLGRIVSTISVLEYSNPDDIQRRLYESIDFQGSELVISAFASVADNIDAQCDNIRYLAAAGEVGLILYLRRHHPAQSRRAARARRRRAGLRAHMYAGERPEPALQRGNLRGHGRDSPRRAVELELRARPPRADVAPAEDAPDREDHTAHRERPPARHDGHNGRGV